jgi:ERCC4-type nuclease
MQRKPKVLIPSWTLIVDNREQTPWNFESVTVGTGKSQRPLCLKTEPGTLKSGDYSIKGMEDKVAIERKSKEDLFSTLSRGRDRFIRELSRLNDLEFAAVMVEAEWMDCMINPPERSRLAPVSLNGMIVAWQIRYPKVHWWFMPGRYVASKQAFKLLDRFWQENNQ